MIPLSASRADAAPDETDGPLLQRARGTGRIAAKRLDGRTRLDRLYEEGCARIRLPRTHGEALEAVLINTAGGLASGDAVDWSAEAGAGTRLALTTQACERVYRSTGRPAVVTARLAAGPGAHIDWLPQETILFEQAALRRRLEVDLAADASLTAVEAVLLGRDAMGEEARRARLSDHWRIRRDGRLVHAEATRLTGESDMERDGLPMLAGARAFATILHVAPEAEQRLDRLRALLPDAPGIAASAMEGRLVVRALAEGGLALRRLIVPVIAALSAAGSLPRLWHS